MGIGPVWPTGSKDISKKVLLGPEGVGGILDVLAGSDVKAVAIGEFMNILQMSRRRREDRTVWLTSTRRHPRSESPSSTTRLHLSHKP